MTNYDTVVRRCNLDGSGLEELYRTPGGGGSYVTLDAQGGRMYFPSTEAGGIMVSNLDGQLASLRISVDERVSTIDIRPSDSSIYWSDSDNSLWKYDLSNDTRSMLVDDGLSIVTAIKTDPNRDYFYWTDRGIGRVMRTTLHGTESIAIVSQGPFGNYPSPTGLALDATRGTLYFSDAYFNAILQVDVDGTNTAFFATDGVVFPTAVAFDEIGQRVYWSNTSSSSPSPYDDSVMSAKLDGTDLRREFVPRNQWGGSLRVTQMTIEQIAVPEPCGGVILSTGIMVVLCPRRSEIQ